MALFSRAPVPHLSRVRESSAHVELLERDGYVFFLRSPHVDLTLGPVIMDAAPFYDRVSPLRFRGIPDSLAASHLEGSECCLIHADNPVSAQKGVWLNPNVRVGYNAPAYEYVHPSSGGGGGGGSSSRNRDAWVSTPEILWGVWQSRLRRWFTTDAVKTWTVLNRLEDWMKADPTETRTEPGAFCLINEMQIVAANGWAHV
jgi:hypothetical protein